MLALLAPFAGYIVAGVTALLGLAGAYFGVRQSGVKAQQNADLKVTLKQTETAHEASTQVARSSDAAVDEQLRSQFSRD